MDVICIFGMVVGGFWALFVSLHEHDYDKKNPWRHGLVLLVICTVGFLYFMTQLEPKVTETREISDTFKTTTGSKIIFSKPVKIKTIEKSYPWTSRGSTFYEVNVE